MYTEFYKILRTEGIDMATDTAQRAGFDSVEMLEIREAALIPDEKSAVLARKALENRGLRVSCYSFAIDIVPFDKYGKIIGNADEAIMKTIKAARIAKSLGSPYFHHTLVTNLRPELHLPKPPYEEMFDTIVLGASEIAQACNAMGLTVLYEPQGFYVNGSKNFGRFYNEMKNRGFDVGVCGDMANTLFVDEPPIEFYKNFVSEFKHVHIKDYELLGNTADPSKKYLWSLGGNAYSEARLGEGAVGFTECMKILKTLRYEGALSLEMNCAPEDTAKAINTVRENYII
jgi:sugar phosphate isomerase/epimerase